MTRPNAPRYAARLNAFKVKGGSVADMIAGVGHVGGISAADLNYPDHFEKHSPAALGRMLADQGMVINGLAMRYYTEAGFKLGAFTHPDLSVRRAAIDLTKRGIDVCAEMGGALMTLWMGQDGYDYSFQIDYVRAWEDTIAAIAEVADHNPAVDIAVEYKPDEPRAFALMPVMAATVHPVQTVELFIALDRAGYDGVIYFDTFPDQAGLNPVHETRANIALTDRLRAIARNLAQNPDLAAATARQDAAAVSLIVANALYR